MTDKLFFQEMETMETRIGNAYVGLEEEVLRAMIDRRENNVDENGEFTTFALPSDYVKSLRNELKDLYFSLGKLLDDYSTRFCTIDEAAEDLDVSRRTVERMIADGRLKATKVGKTYRIDRRYLQKRLESEESVALFEKEDEASARIEERFWSTASDRPQ